VGVVLEFLIKVDYQPIKTGCAAEQGVPLMDNRLGYGELEEEILKNFHPYKDVPEYTAESLWRSTPIHERIVDPVKLNKATEKFLALDKEFMEKKRKELEETPKVTIKKTDLDRFTEETGLKSFEAEKYFILAEGKLEEALLIWVNQEPGQPPKRLIEYENPIHDIV
jgi:hypothetical protein